MSVSLTEISHKRAWRIIRAMQTEVVLDDTFILVRLSCYLNPSLIANNIEKCGYSRSVSEIKKLQVPFPLNLLPIPRPYYFYIFNAKLNQIFDLALSCDDHLMFEILISENRNTNQIEQICCDGNTLYEDSLALNSFCKKYFFVDLTLMIPIMKLGSVKH
ncbi:hypothetical protein [Conchiformibius kuhniae]|uniref:Uncharacterized protein n=1 Tax=Conchiformibius kuhniae TaxID=211502 RepID=A0A8T9MW42_9NEIS|nr:hypothetical protein [Conchiformibius kuhniae]UOP04686.1 hypothetical protein LVJ77_10910 [Conchiformibius kuhniae]